MGEFMKKLSFTICVLALSSLLVQSMFLSTVNAQQYPEKPKIVVLASSIDFGLAIDFFRFLRDKGVELIHTDASNFDKYKEENFIIILGGPDAYEGVGEIVREYLTVEEQNWLRQEDNRKMFVKTKDRQLICIIAGSDRDMTKKAEEENQEKIVGAPIKAFPDFADIVRVTVAPQGLEIVVFTIQTADKIPIVPSTDPNFDLSYTIAFDLDKNSATGKTGPLYNDIGADKEISLEFKDLGWKSDYSWEISENTVAVKIPIDDLSLSFDWIVRSQRGNNMDIIPSEGHSSFRSPKLPPW